MTYTLGDQLKATSGRSTGFDYLRLVLAFGVLFVHSFDTCYTMEAGSHLWPIWAPSSLILPMFFALSGFLVAGSLERNRSLRIFASLRVLRIMPALTVEVLLSALLIGPLVTTTALADYFRDPTFWRYLLNVVGDIHYRLPGVFLHNPQPGLVNGQLWTVPWELACYVSLIGLALVGVARRPWMLLIAVALASVAAFGAMTVKGMHAPTGAYNVHSVVLVLDFLAGVVVHGFRDRLPWGPRAIVVAGLVSWGMMLVFPGEFFAALPTAYFTAALGLANPRRTVAIRGADLSYGVYLYGYVLQQLVASLPWARHWWINLGLALPAALLVAAISWRFVEAPALGLRRYLPRLFPIAAAPDTPRPGLATPSSRAAS